MIIFDIVSFVSVNVKNNVGIEYILKQKLD